MNIHTVHSSVFNWVEGSVGMINKTCVVVFVLDLVGFENVFTIMYQNI